MQTLLNAIARFFFILILVVTLFSCKKTGCTNPYAVNFDSEATEADCSCTFYVDDIIGTYSITLTSYPRQTTEEGTEFETLVFVDYSKCSTVTPDDLKSIQFYNLFTHSGCNQVSLEEYTFTVTLDDNIRWAGAPLKGTGTIKNDIFHFEGTIYTSAGLFPIILDGKKLSKERYKSTC